jgi:hypothetical protein
MKPVLPFLALILTCSCAQQTVDRAKFEKLYRAAQAIERAPLEKQLGGSLIQQFQIEYAVARTLASTEIESEMIQAYSSAEYYLEMVSIRKDNPEFKLTLDLLNVGLSKIKVADTYYEYSSPAARDHMIELRKKMLTDVLQKIPDSLRSPWDSKEN